MITSRSEGGRGKGRRDAYSEGSSDGETKAIARSERWRGGEALTKQYGGNGMMGVCMGERRRLREMREEKRGWRARDGLRTRRQEALAKGMGQEGMKRARNDAGVYGRVEG